MKDIQGIGVIVTTIAICALLIGGLAYWQSTRHSGNQLRPDTKENVNGPLVPTEQKVNDPNKENTMNPTATFKTNMGEFQLELYQDQMPITVGNFVELAKSGFYDNTKFHRVIDGFMIQGGDPNTKGTNEDTWGTGGPERNIQDEFVKGDNLSNVRGTIAMANTGQPNSGGSQFFINLVDNTGLDFDKPPFTSKHPVFGRVIKGVDVVDAIGKVETKERDIPKNPVIIESVTISE